MKQKLTKFRFSPTHEWVRVDGDVAYIGISDYAQESLGDVVYIDAGDEGDELIASEDFGVIESVKAASDLISPVSGTVLAINDEVIDEPELVNDDPYAAWIIKVELSDDDELEDLLTYEEYEALDKE